MGTLYPRPIPHQCQCAFAGVCFVWFVVCVCGRSSFSVFRVSVSVSVSLILKLLMFLVHVWWLLGDVCVFAYVMRVRMTSRIREAGAGEGGNFSSLKSNNHDYAQTIP